MKAGDRASKKKGGEALVLSTVKTGGRWQILTRSKANRFSLVAISDLKGVQSALLSPEERQQITDQFERWVHEVRASLHRLLACSVSDERLLIMGVRLLCRNWSERLDKRRRAV